MSSAPRAARPADPPALTSAQPGDSIRLAPGSSAEATIAVVAVGDRPGCPSHSHKAVVGGEELRKGPRPPLLWAVIDESVLHRRIGGPEIMCEQIAAILATMEDNRYVSLQIVPGDVTVTAGLSGAFVIASAEGAANTVYVDCAAGGNVTDHPRDGAEICTRFEELRTEALPPRASIDLMTKVMTTWKQT